MDRLTAMECFVKAAETGSFVAAGGALGLSAQAVGKQIAALEERLGGRLIHRTTRRHGLTELGQAFYARCKHVLAEAEAADAVAQDLVARPRGQLRVTAPVTLGSYQLMPVVARYLARYPDVGVEVVLTDRYVDLVGEGFEAAIRIGALDDSSLVARRLPAFRLIACAAPAYLAARGRPREPADLAGHECLGYAHVARPPMSDWHFTRGETTAAVPVSSRLRVNGAEALVVAALAGSGIILTMPVVIAAHLAAGRLERVLPEWEGPSRPLAILFAPDRRQTPKLRAFVDMVVADFEGRD